MKTLKVLHLGDLHIDHDPKFKNKIKSSLDQVIEYCKEIKINAVIIPGDIWHRKQSYSNLSGVPFGLEFFHKLSRLVDFVFITKGNHDDVGSIELLHQIEKNVFAYEYPVVLAVKGNETLDLLRDNCENSIVDYIITLIPYPTKASLLIEDSIDNNNANFLEKFEQIFEHIGDVVSDYNCPKILGFHGNISGSRLSTGQTLMGQDIIVAPSTLEKAKQDYYALNHIHLYQEIKPNMFYAGGIANFNWGETEQKSFGIIEFSEYPAEMRVERIMLTSARPMITVDAEFIGDRFEWDESITTDEANANAEFRFRCKVKENERNLITDDKIEWLKTFFGQDVKIEFNIVPVERTARSENIMSSKNLLDEVVEYSKVIDHKIDNGVMTKVAEVQEVGNE